MVKFLRQDTKERICEHVHENKGGTLEVAVDTEPGECPKMARSVGIWQMAKFWFTQKSLDLTFFCVGHFVGYRVQISFSP